MSALRCQVPGCRAIIRGMTGLEELRKLIEHVRRVHGVEWDLEQAMGWRARWEVLK